MVVRAGRETQHSWPVRLCADARGNGAPGRGVKGWQLWEIDENLMRAELGPAEMATRLKRRKELWEIRKNSGPTCPTTPGRPKEFATDTEAKTGTPKRTTNRALAHSVRREWSQLAAHATA